MYSDEGINIRILYNIYAPNIETLRWKILKEMAIPDHLSCLLGNLYAGQEAIVRTGHGTTNWFKIWKTQQWPQDWKKSGFIPIPKKGNAKEYSNYRTIVLISNATKVMLKIL